MKHRWPRSIHSQVEAVFHSVRAFGQAKSDSAYGIRSFGTWKVYKYEAHRFADFMIKRCHGDILEMDTLQMDITDFLEERLAVYVQKKRSRQTLETILSAFGKFEYALNCYINLHLPGHLRLNIYDLRMEFYNRGKKLLRKSSKIFDNRAYPDPVRLIEAITDGTFQLQAALQYEGGLRTEGTGAPSCLKVLNPLDKEGLHGTGTDVVTGLPVGIVAAVEKGGKKTVHYVSLPTYDRLCEHISKYGKLESNYHRYLKAINDAAIATGQYVPGRGSHGLKHSFAQERYLECVNHGMTHEMALQQVSLETAHFRMRETLTYTRG